MRARPAASGTTAARTAAADKQAHVRSRAHRRRQQSEVDFGQHRTQVDRRALGIKRPEHRRVDLRPNYPPVICTRPRHHARHSRLSEVPKLQAHWVAQMTVPCARRTCSRSRAVVTGPTPPGTGDTAPATWAADGSTSPVVPPSEVGLVPTSITTAPG